MYAALLPRRRPWVCPPRFCRRFLPLPGPPFLSTGRLRGPSGGRLVCWTPRAQTNNGAVPQGPQSWLPGCLIPCAHWWLHRTPQPPPPPPRDIPSGCGFFTGALDSHPFSPSHVASGRCVLSAAAAVVACVVFASLGPSSLRTGGCAGGCGGRFTVLCCPLPSAFWSCSFFTGALDSHPFSPSHVASGRCVLSAAAAVVPCVVFASLGPSSLRTGGCAGGCGGRFTVLCCPLPSAFWSCSFFTGALDSHPFSPSRAASGRCVLSAAAAVVACVVFASLGPSSLRTGGCAGGCGGRFTVLCCPLPSAFWSCSFFTGALDSHPFSPSRAASGRCVLSAAAAVVPCVVFASLGPSSLRTGGCAGGCGGRFTVLCCPLPSAFWSCSFFTGPGTVTRSSLRPPPPPKEVIEEGGEWGGLGPKSL